MNLLPYLAGNDDRAPHAQLFWSLEKLSHWAVRDGDWKLVREDLNPVPRRTAQPADIRLQLYNLADDPAEQSDLAGERPEIVARLQQQFDAFVRQSKPSLFTPEVAAREEAALAERRRNPALREEPRTDGSPGHWIGPGAKARLAAEERSKP
jgi:arylsulfatase A-like enzyme